MTAVVDASVVVAALLDEGELGSWAADELTGQRLAAPHLWPVEVTHAVRRLAMSGQVSTEVAALALGDLSDVSVALFPFAAFADRVWELRSTVSPYDAWYVALAEALDVPLVTIDRRLATAPGTRCEFRIP